MSEMNIERLREIVHTIPVVEIRDLNLNSDEKVPSIQTFQTETHVRGMYAHVSTEFTLFNPNHRVLEGELNFPLPDDAVVCGYAIDVNGVMVEGRVVEKEKARIAFENEVKKGIDPGLVEHVKGNAYRTRIYPIPANGSRRIRVSYITPLTISSDGDAAIFLPMPQHGLARRDVVIEVEMPESHPPVLGGLGDKRFEMAKSVWRVESHEMDVKPDDHLMIGLPRVDGAVVSLEDYRGHQYFSASVPVPRSNDASNENVVKSWRIIWDASGSRKQPEIDSALKALEKLPVDGEYHLYVFRNKCEPVQVFHSCEDLCKFVRTVPYDGGTDFGCLKEIAEQDFDGMTLVFSDGLDTYSGKMPVFATRAMSLVSGVSRDICALRRMSGGRVIDLGIVPADRILKNIVSSMPVVSSVEGAGITEVQGIGMSAEGRVTVVGRVSDQYGKGVMKLSDGREFEFDLDPSKLREGNTLASAWAARRVEELSANADDNREELLSLGRYFSIVSPVSSMIVFERLEQWLEYNIEPPESLKEIHDEWIKRHPSESKLEADKLKGEKEWLDGLRTEWKERVAWYENPVPKSQFKHSGVFDDEVTPPPLGAGMGMAAAAMSAPRRLMERAAESFHELRENVSTMMNSRGRVSRSAPRRRPMDEEGCILEDACVPCCECAPCPEPPCAPCPEPPAGNGPDRSDNPPPAATVTIKAWDPQTPYLTALKDVRKIFKDEKSLYDEYLKQRQKFQASPAFYLDCAGFFFKEGLNDIAIRILSNLSELKIDDTALLRVYAWRLREAGELDASIDILKKIIKLRPDEAVSWRDLALTLTIRAKKNKCAQDVTQALEHFHKAVFTPWKRRDAKWTSLVSLEEFNALAEWSKHQDWKGEEPVIPSIDPEFQKNIDTALRIVLMWDADDTDIDLHVLEPSGEEVFYSNKRSQSGGLLSFDVTTGYGPEEYLHRCPPKGTYKIMTNYYASHQQSLTGPVTVTVTVFTNWGRDDETSQILSLRLEKAKDKVSVGSIEV